VLLGLYNTNVKLQAGNNFPAGENDDAARPPRGHSRAFHGVPLLTSEDAPANVIANCFSGDNHPQSPPPPLLTQTIDPSVMAASRLKRPVSHICRHSHTPFVPTQCRTFAATPAHFRPQHRKETFGGRLGAALGRTKIEWYWIPATAGIAFLGGVQFYRVYTREQARKEEEERASTYSDSEEWEEHEPGKKPKKRKRIRPSGPWSEPVTI
jgi:hypothetical protein